MLQRQTWPASTPCTFTRRAPLPQCWLMADARLGDEIARIVADMPPRSAIVIRPYAMGRWGSAAAIRQLIRIARARRHWILYARQNRDHRRFAIDGLHLPGFGPRRSPRGPIASMTVHHRGDAVRAQRIRPSTVLISPIWVTRSHPDSDPVGLRGLARLARTAQAPAIAMGGATPARFRLARRHSAYGWAAIDAWIGD